MFTGSAAASAGHGCSKNGRGDAEPEVGASKRQGDRGKEKGQAVFMTGLLFVLTVHAIQSDTANTNRNKRASLAEHAEDAELNHDL